MRLFIRGTKTITFSCEIDVFVSAASQKLKFRALTKNQQSKPQEMLRHRKTDLILNKCCLFRRYFKRLRGNKRCKSTNKPQGPENDGLKVTMIFKKVCHDLPIEVHQLLASTSRSII